MSEMLQPLVCCDLRQAYPEFFAPWEGKNSIFPPSFHRGDGGEIVLDLDDDHLLATTDGGASWQRYAGARLWPAGYFESFRIGEELVALHGGQELRRSRDGGRTWRAPEPIAPAALAPEFPDAAGPCVFSVMATRAGRIVIPEDYITARESWDKDLLFANSSGDGGRTWQRSGVIEPPDPLPKGPGQTEAFGEPAIVELSDGTLWMVFRASFGQLWQCVSRDGGVTWSPPSPTGLASPLANVKAARIPGTETILLVWNFARPGPSRDFGVNPSAYHPRSPLVFSVSHDGCKTWSCPTVIYAGTGIYASLYFTDAEIYVLFMSNPDPDIGGDATFGMTLAVYTTASVLAQPAWTHETIRPYIDAGLVSHWMDWQIP